jgi:two-component system OmpR family response regulator
MRLTLAPAAGIGEACASAEPVPMKPLALPLVAEPMSAMPLPPARSANPMVPARTPAEALQVLLIDNDAQDAARIAQLLTGHGFRVCVARSAAEGEAQLRASAPDLVLLEVALPDEDGLSLCRRLALREGPPVVIVARRCEMLDRVIGLEFGAHDYLAKDCHPLELLARVKAALRRRPATPPRLPPAAADLAWEGWILCSDGRLLQTPDGRSIQLSRTGFRLLATFFEHPGAVLTRADIRRVAYDADTAVADRSIDVMTCRLRRILQRRAGHDFIASVRGLGYRLVAPPVSC